MLKENAWFFMFCMRYEIRSFCQSLLLSRKLFHNTFEQLNMELVLIFLILVVSLVREVSGNYAQAEIYLAGTNGFIRTIGFNEQEVAWCVIISGSVNHLRHMATLVRQLVHFTSSLFWRKRKNQFNIIRWSIEF
jgi:hypothetical protein